MLLPGSRSNERGAGQDTGVCQFSGQCESLALSGGDGRVRLFDTGTGRLQLQLSTGGAALAVTPDAAGDAAALSCTSLTWLPVAHSGKAERAPLQAFCRAQPRFWKSKRKAPVATGLGSLLVGTRSGAVTSWDAASGDAQWRTKPLHDGPLTAMALSADGAAVLCAAGEEVVEVATASGEVNQRWAPGGGASALTVLSVSPDGTRLLVGTRDGGLSLYDTSSRRRLVALAGHSAAGGASPCGAAFTQDGRFCMSVATGDRSVAIWRVPASGEGGASNGKSAKAAGGRAVPAMLRLALPDSWPVQVTCAAAGDGGSAQLLAVVVSHAGEAFVWRCQCTGTGEAAELTVLSAAPVRIRVGAHAAPGKQAGADGVLTAQARVESAQGDASLLVSYGNHARPHFTRLPLPADGGDDNLVIGGSTNEEEAGGRRGARGTAASSAAVAVLGGDNAADAAMHRPKPASLRHGTPGASLAGGASGGDVAMEDAGNGELTLGERLRALELAAGTAAAAFRAAPAGAGEEAMDADRADGEAAAAAGGDASHWRRVVTSLDAGAAPRADSLVILLTQALGSSDGALLERVLSVSQASVVSNTCNLLSPQLALSFLAACVARLQAKPVRGAHLARWIRALLVAHAAHFANSPLAGMLLASLYGILDTRLALYRPLLALSGRLDLVLAAHARGKATSQANGEDGDDDDGGANHLPIVYDEPDGAEVEVEDARGGVGDSDDDASEGDDADDDAGEEDEEDGADSDAWETDDDDV